MGAIVNLIDGVLFLFFLFMSIVGPLMDAQTCFPKHIFPSMLVELNAKYARDYNDYLVSEEPHFYLGLIWVELLFQWPLAVACVYGIAARKSWLNTTCLMYGVSTFTSMVAILAELTQSKRASNDLLMIYVPFLGFSLLALFRGLLTRSGKSGAIEKRTPPSKKRA